MAIICRLCLCELASKRAVALFSEVGLHQNWPSRLPELLRVPVSIEDGLSQRICRSCSGKVETVERKLQALRQQARESIENIMRLLAESVPRTPVARQAFLHPPLKPVLQLSACTQQGQGCCFLH